MNPYTIVRIESFDGKDKHAAQVESPSFDLSGEEIGQLLRQAMLGAGYHPDTVSEVFNEEDIS